MEKTMIIYRFKFVGYQSEDNPNDDNKVTGIRNVVANNEHDAWERFKKIVACDYKHYEFKSMKKMQKVYVSKE